MLNRQEVTSRVESLLNEYCQQKIVDAESIAPGYVELWKEISNYLAGGGKRIRPYLVMLAYSSYGGKDYEKILPVACAWELLHAFSLVHDDIIDRDVIRHGSKNISGKYQDKYSLVSKDNSEHFALSAALLAGDLLLSAAYDIVSNSQLSPEDKMEVIGDLNSVVYSVGGGEFIDMESSLYPVLDVDPIVIAHYKTATYSFQLPLVCGARLAKASQEELTKLSKIGIETGIAFQLQDDLLGVFGEEDKTGKSNRSDIYEKKRTLLIQRTLRQLPSGLAEELQEIFNSSQKISELEVDQVLKMINQTDSREFVASQINERVDTSVNLVKELSMDDLGKQILTELIYKSGSRTF